jgi:hypothetical protein
MRRFALLSSIGALVVGAGVVMAATPPASPAPTTGSPAAASATATPAPTSTGQAAAGAQSTATWQASLKPLNAVTGTARIKAMADGRGLLTVKLMGLRAYAVWTVDVDGGLPDQSQPPKHPEIALVAGSDFTRVSSDTLNVRLTAAQMKRFTAEQKADGVTIRVSDGRDISIATIAAGSASS